MLICGWSGLSVKSESIYRESQVLSIFWELGRKGERVTNNSLWPNIPTPSFPYLSRAIGKALKWKLPMSLKDCPQTEDRITDS